MGAWLSLLMRVHLVWPKLTLPFLGEIKPEGYLAQLTMHGTLMVFFVLSTVPQSGFGTFFLPLQLGASNMAFPRLTATGFWTALLSFLNHPVHDLLSRHSTMYVFCNFNDVVVGSGRHVLTAIMQGACAFLAIIRHVRFGVEPGLTQSRHVLSIPKLAKDIFNAGLV